MERSPSKASVGARSGATSGGGGSTADGAASGGSDMGGVSGILAALLSFPARTDRSSLHDFTSLDVDRQPHDLSQHRGKVVVVTNVASY